jgi:hypothetical protein
LRAELEDSHFSFREFPDLLVVEAVFAFAVVVVERDHQDSSFESDEDDVLGMNEGSSRERIERICGNQDKSR